MDKASTVVYAALSEKGPVREENQDGFLAAAVGAEPAEGGRFVLDDGLFLLAVADGMGGGPAGRQAADCALACLRAEVGRVPGPAAPADERLRRAFEEANRRVCAVAASDPALKGMGTTLTAALVEGGTLHLAHVGDTRAYLLRSGELTALTTDHSLLGKVMGMGAEQARRHIFKNILAQCIGGRDAGVAVELSRLPLRRGDVVLLSSDGLHGAVPDPEIREALSSADDPAAAGKALIELALKNDTADNVTALVARFDGDALQPPSPGTGGLVRLVEAVYDPSEGRLEPRPCTVEVSAPRPLPRSWLGPTAFLVCCAYASVFCAAVLKLSRADEPPRLPPQARMVGAAPRRGVPLPAAPSPTAPGAELRTTARPAPAAPVDSARRPATKPAPAKGKAAATTVPGAPAGTQPSGRPIPAEEEEPAAWLRRAPPSGGALGTTESPPQPRPRRTTSRDAQGPLSPVSADTRKRTDGVLEE